MNKKENIDYINVFEFCMMKRYIPSGQLLEQLGYQILEKTSNRKDIKLFDKLNNSAPNFHVHLGSPLALSETLQYC